MTDFCQPLSMSRLFETLERRVFQYPTLRNLTVPCMGLLRFSLSEAVEKSVRYMIRANFYSCGPICTPSLRVIPKKSSANLEQKKHAQKNHLQHNIPAYSAFFGI